MTRRWVDGLGEQREFITDGSKEITGTDILKSIVQMNNRAYFLQQTKWGGLHPHWALCQGLVLIR